MSFFIPLRYWLGNNLLAFFVRGCLLYCFLFQFSSGVREIVVISVNPTLGLFDRENTHILALRCHFWCLCYTFSILLYVATLPIFHCFNLAAKLPILDILSLHLSSHHMVPYISLYPP